MSDAGNSTNNTVSSNDDASSENTGPDPSKFQMRRSSTSGSTNSTKNQLRWATSRSGTIITTKKKHAEPIGLRQALDDAGWDKWDPTYNAKMKYVVCTTCPSGQCTHDHKSESTSTTTPSGTGTGASANASTGSKKKAKEKSTDVKLFSSSSTANQLQARRQSARKVARFFTS